MRDQKVMHTHILLSLSLSRVGDTNSQPEELLSSYCFLAVFDAWSSPTKLLIKITGVCRDSGVKVSSLIVFISFVLQ